MDNQGHNRREFLEKVAVGVAGATLGLPLVRDLGAATGEMPYRTMGRSGEKISLLGLGGAHIGGSNLDEQEAIRIVRTAIDNGINFMDNSWDYHGGDSEIRMGKALKNGYRQKVFLMTKIDGRTRASATAQMDDCLRRLQVETIDLLQFHEVIRPDDPERIFAAGGAFEALMDAKKAGKIRYIGFTGHKDPDIHLKMVNMGLQHGFPFDAVQMPLNVMDPHYRSFAKEVVPVLVKHRIGVLGMKSMGGGMILRSNTATPIECLHYAMNLQTSVVIAGMPSLERLNQGLEAARSFRPMSEKEVAALLAKTAIAGAQGEFEGFKTTSRFDATSRNPQWLG
jgi:predicted aldo/keto reductase-like oxidoreductase